jgi:hypothetical protein
MNKGRQTAKRGRDVTVGLHGITKEAQLRWIALARLAQTGKRPASLDDWQADPQTVDAVLGYRVATALAMQQRAMDRGLAPDAASQDVVAGAMAAKNVLDRKLGRPVERVMSVGHVLVEFQGLDPSKLPDAPPEDQSEVVDVALVDDGKDGE